MTGVMLDQSVVPILLFIVHGHVYPMGGNGRYNITDQLYEIK
jgi:hypothetical protein